MSQSDAQEVCEWVASASTFSFRDPLCDLHQWSPDRVLYKKTSDVLSAVFYMKNMVTIYIISIHKGMIITHEYYVSILLSTIQSFNSLHQYYVYSLIWVYALLQTIMNLIIKKTTFIKFLITCTCCYKNWHLQTYMHDLKYMSLFKSSLEYKIVTKVQNQTFHASSPSGFIKI